MRGLTEYRPHVTLAGYTVNALPPYAAHLATVAAALAPFPVRLESVGIFPEHRVLFLAPRMSLRLFSLHSTILETMSAVPEAEQPVLLDEVLLPDRWTPHVTLIGGVTHQQLLQGLDLCLATWAPICGDAAGIGLRILPDPSDAQYYPLQN